MTTFDNRKNGFEKKFAHDEELQFKATARRNKLLGLWAAEKLGLPATPPRNMPRMLWPPTLKKLAMTTWCARLWPISRPRTWTSRNIRSAARWMN